MRMADKYNDRKMTQNHQQPVQKGHTHNAALKLLISFRA